MKTIYKIFLFISIIGVAHILYSHICGEDGIICVEGMPGCENCDFGGPGPGYYPKDKDGSFLLPEVPVWRSTGEPIYLPDYWPTLIAPIGGPIQEASPKELVLQQVKNTECEGVNRANALANTSGFMDIVNQIRNKNVEWASAIKLHNPNDLNSLYFAVPYTNANPSENHVNINPTWNSNSGYTLGFIHNHPSGSAPSPSDLFNAALNIRDIINDGSIPPSQLEMYLRNYTSVIISGEYIYTITIENAMLFSLMAGEFNKARINANNQFTNIQKDYFTKNNIGEPATSAEKQAAGELALTKMYEKMINLNKQKIGDTNNNETIKKDNKGKMIKTNPCTP